MRAAILAIGDEIVAGLTTDTNSGFVAAELRALGVDAAGFLAVPDDPEAILGALARAAADAELVVCTGGLGPTADDLTTACVARFAGRPLELHAPSLEAIRERFRARGLEMSDNNRKQALFPAGAEVFPNPQGTAPGFVCPVESAGRAVHVACFPGVPREMRAMVAASLLPWVAARRSGRRFLARTFSTVGVSESRLDELLAGAFAPGECRLAFRAAFPRMTVRLTVEGAEGGDLEGRMEGLEARLRERLGEAVYAVGNVGIEEVVGRMLAERGLTLAVAESCTGGRIGDWITDVPGSSAYFLGGVAAYDDRVKTAVLGVPAELIERHGAVSPEVAEAMAEGARRISGASLALSTTGIAGPGGGTPEKPVGTVCIALAWEGGRWSRRYDLGDRGRDWVKTITALTALDRLRRHLREGR